MTDKEKFDPLKAVVIRNRFYSSSYRRLLLILTISVIMNIALGGGYYYMVEHPVTPVYFATRVSGTILPVFPLDAPNHSDDEVINWTEKAAMASFTYNYTNYRREFQASSDFFSPYGWTQLLEAIKASNNLDAVIDKKMVVSAQLGKFSKSIIVSSGKLTTGHYGWKIRVPLLVTYQSTTEYSQQKTMVTMLIVRLSNLNSPSGLGIEQFVVSPVTEK